MDRDALDIIEKKRMAAKEFVQRRHREVAKMLMVDGVELLVVDEIFDVGHLKRR